MVTCIKKWSNFNPIVYQLNLFTMEFMFNILQHICRLPMGDYLQCYKILFFTIFIVCSMEVKVWLSLLIYLLSSLLSMLSNITSNPELKLTLAWFICSSFVALSFCTNFSTNVCRINTFFSQVRNFGVLVVQNHALKFLNDL